MNIFDCSIKDHQMKPLILTIILAFTITHATAQSLTCRPLPNGTTICSPTPTGGAAGIGPALAAVVVLYFVIQYLKKDKEAPPDNGQQ
jgi:hypothetical protein